MSPQYFTAQPIKIVKIKLMLRHVPHAKLKILKIKRKYFSVFCRKVNTQFWLNFTLALTHF